METPRDVQDRRRLLITILPRGDVAEDKKRMLVGYDKKQMWNIGISSRGDVASRGYDRPRQTPLFYQLENAGRDHRPGVRRGRPLR